MLNRARHWYPILTTFSLLDLNMVSVLPQDVLLRDEGFNCSSAAARYRGCQLQPKAKETTKKTNQTKEIKIESQIPKGKIKKPKSKTMESKSNKKNLN